MVQMTWVGDSHGQLRLDPRLTHAAEAIPKTENRINLVASGLWLKSSALPHL